MGKNLLVLLACLMVAACATPYQRKGATGGFTETQIRDNVFAVAFQGNGYTTEQRAIDFTLLRSAELAYAHGFRYFVIAATNSSVRRETVVTSPARAQTDVSGSVTGNSFYGTATTTATPAQTLTFAMPSTRMTIVGFTDEPDVDGVVYDARYIINSIRSSYGLKD